MTALCSQSQYRVKNGLLMPSLTSSWWISDGVALAPSNSCAASPGSEFITTKLRKVTPNSTGMAASSRRMMNCSVGEPASRLPTPARAASGALSGAELLLMCGYPLPHWSLREGHVLPQRRRVDHDRRDHRGEAWPLDAVHGDVPGREREQERPVGVLGDVLRCLLVELVATRGIDHP